MNPKMLVAGSSNKSPAWPHIEHCTQVLVPGKNLYIQRSKETICIGPADLKCQPVAIISQGIILLQVCGFAVCAKLYTYKYIYIYIYMHMYM